MIRTLIFALGALAIVFWIGLAYWVNKDARRRIRHPFAIGVATLLGLVPYAGPLVYLLFRPAETRNEIRSRDAELAALEAMLVHRGPTCPECSATVEAAFLVCPVCMTRLRDQCVHCEAALERLWQMCPYCATPIEPELDLDGALNGALLRETRSVSALDHAAEAAEV